MDEALALYGALESEVERGPYRAYRMVLRMVLEGFGARLGFVPTETELEHFAASVPAWPPFPDSAPALQALHQKYQLAIISNIDDDLFAMSAQHLHVQFDWIITAQQAQSYKPSLHNFHMALARIECRPRKSCMSPRASTTTSPGQDARLIHCLDQPTPRATRFWRHAPSAGAARFRSPGYANFGRADWVCCDARQAGDILVQGVLPSECTQSAPPVRDFHGPVRSGAFIPRSPRPLSHLMTQSLTALPAGQGRDSTGPPSRCSMAPQPRAGWRRARRGSSVRGGCSHRSRSSRRR